MGFDLRPLAEQTSTRSPVWRMADRLLEAGNALVELYAQRC